MAGLYSKLCFLKDKDVTLYIVSKDKEGKGQNYERNKRKEGRRRRMKIGKK
jgi:hypothetical protein